MVRGFPVLSFADRASPRAWLVAHHARSAGIYLRLSKKRFGIPSVSFEEVLDEGLCFGWSERTRLRGDDTSYLQRFTPRRTKGTTSERNRDRIRRLIDRGVMTPAGLAALETASPQSR
jgi:uncharacterized protein YdeI (YjbR/CyaY-like superfamily)